jgi:hypothetical protein
MLILDSKVKIKKRKKAVKRKPTPNYNKIFLLLAFEF